jgi:hypothetical protein
MEDLITVRSSTEIVNPPTTNPTTRDTVAEASRYLAGKRDELLRQVAEIEGFLGFAQQADDLAVRVAKLEKFLGIAG